MAGFALDEPYFVPRTKIGLPADIDTCIMYVLGSKYQTWKEQQQAPTGDKSECAEKFFSRLIPFLVEILMQDGIFLIKEFPEHPMSQHLMVRTSRWYLFATILLTLCMLCITSEQSRWLCPLGKCKEGRSEAPTGGVRPRPNETSDWSNRGSPSIIMDPD